MAIDNPTELCYCIGIQRHHKEIKDMNNPTFTTLDEMLHSKEFDSYQGDALGNGLCLHDPDRYNRLQWYSQNGSDGSTHAEVIQDWRDFLDISPFDIWDDEQQAIKDAIIAEIDACEERHEKAGTLYKVIGGDGETSDNWEKAVRYYNEEEEEDSGTLDDITADEAGIEMYAEAGE